MTNVIRLAGAIIKRGYLSPCALALAIFLLPPVGESRAHALTIADLDPTGRYKLREIELSGLHAASPAEVLSVMATRERVWYELWKPLPDFDPQAFVDDLPHIKRFYEARGYYAARITYNLDLHANEVVVYLVIEEGQPIRVVSIDTHVASGMPSPLQIAPSFTLPLKKGDVFDQGVYQSAAQDLGNLYTNHSYAHTVVLRHAIVEVGSLRARVKYDIQPNAKCVFGETAIKGLQKTAPSLVREQLTYHGGEPYDSRKLTASRDAIVALNIFNAVDVEPQNDPAHPTIVPIAISVHEGPKHTLHAGIGYNTESQLNATIGWTDYNFSGGGRQLALSGTYSNTTSSFDVKLMQPHFPTDRFSLTLEASQQQQVYQTYTANISGFDPHLDYKITSYLDASIGWRFEYLKFNSVNVSTIRAIGGFRRSGILSGPDASITFNDTEDPFNPQSGEILSLVGNISDHSLGTDYRYWRIITEAKKYQYIGWQTVLATRLEVGISNTLGRIGDVPLSERFYSGGEGSVRGYGLRRIGPLSGSNDPRGGLSLIEASVELRRPLFWRVNGALFFDCGQVGTRAYDLRVDALQCGYGPAIGIKSPVGPINFYIGFPTEKPRNDSRWQFYFSIGPYF